MRDNDNRSKMDDMYFADVQKESGIDKHVANWGGHLEFSSDIGSANSFVIQHTMYEKHLISGFQEISTIRPKKVRLSMTS